MPGPARSASLERVVIGSTPRERRGHVERRDDAEWTTANGARSRSRAPPRARPSAASRARADRPSSRSAPATPRSARAVTSSRSSSRAVRTRSASVTTPQCSPPGESSLGVDDDRVDAIGRHHPGDRPQRRLGRARDHSRVHHVDDAELSHWPEAMGRLERRSHVAPPAPSVAPAYGSGIRGLAVGTYAETRMPREWRRGTIRESVPEECGDDHAKSPAPSTTRRSAPSRVTSSRRRRSARWTSLRPSAFARHLVRRHGVAKLRIRARRPGRSEEIRNETMPKRDGTRCSRVPSTFVEPVSLSSSSAGSLWIGSSYLFSPRIPSTDDPRLAPRNARSGA